MGLTAARNVCRIRGNRGSHRNGSYSPGARDTSFPVVVSMRKRSDQTLRGRQTTVSRAKTTAARAPIPNAIPAVSPLSPAFAMNEPRPGRVYVCANAVKVSLATRKNHPFDHDRIELYTSFGIAAGKARRRNRSHPRSPKLAAAASRSTGTVERDSYTPNAMFHDMLVKMRKTTANSIPNGWPWNAATKNNRAGGKKPRIGTD